jgi:hypothetical protein
MTAQRTAACACTLPARRIFSTTGFTCQCFIIFCAAGMCTLLLVSPDHGSAAAATAEAAAVAEEPAAVAGSAVMGATAAAATAMALEAGVTVAAASLTSSTRNFFFK